jgi:hypothetical protein
MFIYRSSYMIYHVVCIKSNTTSATSGAGSAGTAGASEFIPSCMSEIIYGFISFGNKNIKLEFI